jgi:hypothetical protein
MICMWICASAEFALLMIVMSEANPRGGGGQRRTSLAFAMDAQRALPTDDQTWPAAAHQI